MPLRRDKKLFPKKLSEEEAIYEKSLKNFLKEESGYQFIQGTRPQTLSYSLNDSPAGLAAWICEKFYSWSDCGGNIYSTFSKDQLLSNVSLYWFTQAIGSSFWPYYSRIHGSWPIPDKKRINVPIGYCEFPFEILRPPRSLAENYFSNIVRWSIAERGGHFAAMEQPEVLANEIHKTFKNFF
tara:strand:- start:837 stop:1382 length:546 start_codon:yes stop_codon:yes gene_type:complete